MYKPPCIDLPFEEWDFRSIPEDEQEFAVIYEYTRSCPVVSKAFEDWLDTKVGDLQLEYESDPESRIVDLGDTMRDSIAQLLAHDSKLPCRYGSELRSLKIGRHPLSTIDFLLVFWPQPYVAVMNDPLFREGVRMLQDKGDVDFKQRSVWPVGRYDEGEGADAERRTYDFIGQSGGYYDWPVGLPIYGFEIDMRKTMDNIVDDFRDWLRPKHDRFNESRGDEAVTRGRKPGTPTNAIALKTLSAMRLSQSGFEGEPMSFDDIYTALDNYLDDLDSPGEKSSEKRLPYYSRKDKLADGVKVAERFRETFECYEAWDPELKKRVLRDWSDPPL